MRILRFSMLVVTGAMLASFSTADIYQVKSRSSLAIHLNPNGWPTAEVPFTAQPAWSATVDTHQVFAKMDNPRGVWALRQTNASGMEGTWFGNFGAGQRVAYVDSPTPPMTFFFGAPDPNAPGGFARFPVSGFGLQIESKDTGGFVAQIRGYNVTSGTWSPWFTVQGNSAATADGTAPFLGIGSTDRNIGAVQLRARALSNVAYGWWAVNAPNIALAPNPSPAAVGPTP